MVCCQFYVTAEMYQIKIESWQKMASHFALPNFANFPKLGPTLARLSQGTSPGKFHQVITNNRIIKGMDKLN